MPDLQTLILFIAAGLLLNLTPGPDMALVVARSAQGLRPGIAAALGISAGCLVHTVAAALGLSALLATSATAFDVVKGIGAAYLLVVGARRVGVWLERALGILFIALAARLALARSP